MERICGGRAHREQEEDVFGLQWKSLLVENKHLAYEESKWSLTEY
jgi:hypothetical protein